MPGTQVGHQLQELRSGPVDWKYAVMDMGHGHCEAKTKYKFTHGTGSNWGTERGRGGAVVLFLHVLHM